MKTHFPLHAWLYIHYIIFFQRGWYCIFIGSRLQSHRANRSCNSTLSLKLLAWQWICYITIRCISKCYYLYKYIPCKNTHPFYPETSPQVSEALAREQRREKLRHPSQPPFLQSRFPLPLYSLSRLETTVHTASGQNTAGFTWVMNFHDFLISTTKQQTLKSRKSHRAQNPRPEISAPYPPISALTRRFPPLFFFDSLKK